MWWIERLPVAVGLAVLLAACSSATAPTNPCASDMATLRQEKGAPPMGTHNWSPTIQAWQYSDNYVVKFDWTSGACVETVLEQ